MKHRGVVAGLVAFLAVPGLAEYRTWTGSSGSQLVAELVGQSGTTVILRDESGRELRVSRTYLSRFDLEYLDSMTTPVVAIDPDIRVHSEYQSGIGVVQMVRYSIEIRKVSSDPYEAPVMVDICLVGTIGDRRTYALLQKTQQEIRFVPGVRNVTVSGPDLSLGSTEMQKKFDVAYAGYLLVVSTKDGRLLAVDSDSDLLKAHAGFLVGLSTGDLFGKDMQRIR